MRKECEREHNGPWLKWCLCKYCFINVLCDSLRKEGHFLSQRRRVSELWALSPKATTFLLNPEDAGSFIMISCCLHRFSFLLWDSRMQLCSPSLSSSRISSPWILGGHSNVHTIVREQEWWEKYLGLQLPISLLVHTYINGAVYLVLISQQMYFDA